MRLSAFLGKFYSAVAFTARNALRICYRVYYLTTQGVYRLFVHPLKKMMFCACGKNVKIGKGGNFTYQSISIGHDVFIGSGARFRNNKRITIGNYIMFGPNVTIFGGNHEFSTPGVYMFSAGEEKTERDISVTICDDVWIGGGAKIMSGVTIGRGCVIAAGSIVTKSCEPYGIYAGVPAKRLRDRFTAAQIKIHEEKLQIS